MHKQILILPLFFCLLANTVASLCIVDRRRARKGVGQPKGWLKVRAISHVEHIFKCGLCNSAHHTKAESGKHFFNGFLDQNA